SSESAASAAGLSPEAASFTASMPVLRAFMREMALPCSVRGPVESCALARLAAICFWVGIRPPSASTVAGEGGRFRAVGRQVIEGEGRRGRGVGGGGRRKKVWVERGGVEFGGGGGEGTSRCMESARDLPAC